MCGRFAQTLPEALLLAAYAARPAAAAPPPSWNIAPRRAVAVVRGDERGGRALDRMGWGLVAPWEPHPDAAHRRPHKLNAESFREQPLFAEPFDHGRRCLVPACAWYEWQGEGLHPRAHAVRRRDGAPAAFAAVWERWRGWSGETVCTVAIATARAPEPMRALHPRVPVALTADKWDAWLDGGPREAEALLRPACEGLEVWAVGAAVDDPARDGPGLLAA